MWRGQQTAKKTLKMDKESMSDAVLAYEDPRYLKNIAKDKRKAVKQAGEELGTFLKDYQKDICFYQIFLLCAHDVLI